MKANEFMIGDWVYNKHHGKNIRLTQYDFFTHTHNEFGEQELAPFAMPTFGRDLEAIPITAEILEKNGWKHEFDKADYMVKYDLGKEGKNCWMMWAIKEHNLDIQRQDEKLDMYNLKVSKVVIPCDYVHELQNAMRICGIEKEIEL